MMTRVGFGLLSAVVAAALALGGGAIVQAQSGKPAAPAAGIASGMLPGYLPKGAAPNSLSVLPPAPGVDTATQLRDEASQEFAVTLQGGPRWDLATKDADLRFPGAADTFSCALDVKVGPDNTPKLYTLLRRTLADAGLATYPTKTKYMRPRPFMVKGGEICTPADAERLRNDGSFPSGHAAVGWAWALILAEAAPDRQDAILARGRAFVQSRVVCNVHWRSDTEEGAMMGSAVVARLHDQPEFRADLDAAKGEIAAARAAGQHPSRDCRAEAAALASAPLDEP
jgi:acid phosphatase (class A)